jgi:hypothetical protein
MITKTRTATTNTSDAAIGSRSFGERSCITLPYRARPEQPVNRSVRSARWCSRIYAKLTADREEGQARLGRAVLPSIACSSIQPAPRAAAPVSAPAVAAHKGGV